MTARMDHCPSCGAVFGNSRSIADHRRLFGLIAKAYDSWPESHAFQPSSAEHLRAFLLVSVGHFDVASIPAPPECADNPAIMSLFRLAVEATGTALSQKCGYFDIRVGAGGVEILTPRSINWSAVAQKQFGPIREAIEAAIELAIGVTADRLLKEQAA